jgi:hypothetical protein
VTAPERLNEALLVLGLEDMIPLAEILITQEVLDAVDPQGSVEDQVPLALIELLRQGRIQVWRGRWDEEPRLVGAAAAEPLIRDGRRYSFDSEQVLGLDRVYYVNVENFRA